jgi:porphobilinogen deaminase
MAGKEKSHPTGTWIVKDVPRELMHRVKVAAAVQRKTVKQLLFDLAEAHLQELERTGILPKER